MNRMKALVPMVLLSSLVSGCSSLGYFKREKAERASPEETAAIRFPGLARP